MKCECIFLIRGKLSDFGDLRDLSDLSDFSEGETLAT
jgi:hypothetical protein